jgi:acyl-CoA thioester hydrolase
LPWIRPSATCSRGNDALVNFTRRIGQARDIADTGKALSANSFIFPVRVYYEDTDAAGIVYYANHLKYMERARTEWLRSLGFELPDLKERQGVLFTVAKLALEYRKPALFNDTLSVSVEVERMARTYFDLIQRVTRTSEELICRGTVRVACVDAGTLKPRGIPQKLITEFQRVI